MYAQINSRGTGSTFGITRFLISDCLQSMCTVKNELFYLYTVLSASLSTPVLNYPPVDCPNFFVRSVIRWNGPSDLGLCALSLQGGHIVQMGLKNGLETCL